MPAKALSAIFSKQGIGARILLIALVPSLITAFLLTAFLVRHTMDRAEQNARTGLLSTARNLASASQYGLISGNQELLKQAVGNSLGLENLQFARVQAEKNLLAAEAGSLNIRLPSPLPATGVVTEYPGIWLSVAPITLPEIAPSEVALDAPEFSLGINPEISPNTNSAGPGVDITSALAPSIKTIGYAVAAISTAPMQASRRAALALAAGLALASALLTALIAWRMSKQLTDRIRHISQTVDKISGGQLDVRVHAQPTAELGVLEDGINRMAHGLQIHHNELQARITEATAVLLEKKDEAERANIAKSRFFAAASHDLRQPLHALSLFSEVLAQKTAHLTGNPDLPRLADQIASSVYSMQALLNALLDVSRLDANIIEVSLKHFPVSQILERIRKQYESAAKEKGLTLNIRACDCTLHSDPILLERILLNLVSNAIRYTDRGGVLLACRKRGNNMLIQVWDTGVGIPDNTHENIFQEFVQLSNPERDRNKGLGLGLAIVARMASLLGTSVTLRSHIGHGSVFSVQVPLGSAQRIEQAESPPPAGMTIEGRLGVLVDDEESVLAAMQELFNTWNLDLIAARSASDAISQLQRVERTPDFLITDYRLPGNTDGIEVARQFHKQFGDALPTMILTGDTAPGTLQRITQAGFVILHKPVRPARLRAMLMHMLAS